MNRNERFEAIAVCDRAALRRLAERCLHTVSHVTVLRPPAPGVVMMRVREPAQASLFNLGEVTVTEAEVEAGGHRGYALTMGLDAAAALAGAIVDAAAEAAPELLAEIEETLTAAVVAEAERRHNRWLRVAPTRVEFDEIP